MSLNYYLLALRKRWLLVVAVTLVAILAALGITLATKPTYAGDATLYVALNQSAGQQSATFAQSLVQSFPSQVQSPSVLSPVIAELHLDTTVHELDDRVTASNPTGTFNLVVSAEGRTAKEAQRLTNAVARSLARQIDELEAAKASSSGAEPATARVTVPSTLPTAPASPRPVLNIALGVLVGLALGVGLAIARERMDTTVKSVEDLSRSSGASALGTIRYDAEFAAHALVSMHEDQGGLEDFRSIRTKLQFVDVDAPPQVIVISSAIANEGKTVAACNIAITMAQADLTVCLVEGDLRRPRVASYLGVDGALGLTDVVAGTHQLDDALIPWHQHQITVLPAGTTPPDPVQFLGSQATGYLLDELRQRFDLVIIDAPPLLPVTDAAVLGAVSDGVILIARYRHVRRDQFAAALDGLKAVHARHLGSVLTQVPRRKRQGEYSYSFVGPAPESPEGFAPQSVDVPDAFSGAHSLGTQRPRSFARSWRPPSDGERPGSGGSYRPAVIGPRWTPAGTPSRPRLRRRNIGEPPAPTQQT